MATSSDDFNRGDGSDLGTSWDINKNSWHIVTNRAEPGRVDDDVIETWNAVGFSADQFSQAELAVVCVTSSAEAGCGVGCRWDAGTVRTGYWVVCSDRTADDTYLAKQVAGTYTLLGSADLGWVANDVCRIEAEGTTIRVKKNTVQQISVSDSAVASGRPAVVFSSGGVSTAPALDNWQGGDLAADVPIPPRPVTVNQAVQFAASW